MSTQAPQVLSRRANGTLPAPGSHGNESGKRKNSGENASQQKIGRGRGSGEKHGDTKRNTQTEKENPKPAKSKAHSEGEKLVIRRLPPGMTQAEFVTILGTEWELGKGRVDWFSYAPGKISTDPAKPSRPARAYVHVTRKDHILALNDTVRTSKWEDAQVTFNNPSLIGPPCVEMAIYKKVPSNKKRTDARQGTIDQDPEFMAFLEDLANPTPPKESVEDDGEDVSKAEAKVTTTPLIEYLKEKKANKVKEAAAAKSAKHGRQESGTGKGKGSKDDDSSKKKGKDSKSSKADKTPKETVKILTKKAAVEQAAEAAKAAASQATRTNAQEAPPKSRRAGIAAAAKILQRDLGLSPGSAHRKARQDAAKAEADAKTTTTKEPASTNPERPASPAPSTDAAPQSSKTRNNTPKEQKSQSGRKNRGGKGSEKNKAAATSGDGGAAVSTPAPPVVLLKKKGGEVETAAPAAPITVPPSAKEASGSKPATPSGPKNKAGSSQKKAATVTADATRGFVKHANPSQGVTEALLKQALEVYGTITFVEIDKRKGFAYVDFAEHEGLVKAVSASPVSVAQGTVQVLERKDKKPANVAPSSGASGPGAPEKSSGRGRRGRGGGNKANASPAAGSQPASTAAASSGG